MSIFVQAGHHIIDVTKVTHIVQDPASPHEVTVYFDSGYKTVMSTDESDAMLNAASGIRGVVCIIAEVKRPQPPQLPPPLPPVVAAALKSKHQPPTERRTPR